MPSHLIYCKSCHRAIGHYDKFNGSVQLTHVRLMQVKLCLNKTYCTGNRNQLDHGHISEVTSRVLDIGDHMPVHRTDLFFNKNNKAMDKSCRFFDGQTTSVAGRLKLKKSNLAIKEKEHAEISSDDDVTIIETKPEVVTIIDSDNALSGAEIENSLAVLDAKQHFASHVCDDSPKEKLASNSNVVIDDNLPSTSAAAGIIIRKDLFIDNASVYYCLLFIYF